MWSLFWSVIYRMVLILALPNVRGNLSFLAPQHLGTLLSELLLPCPASHHSSESGQTSFLHTSRKDASSWPRFSIWMFLPGPQKSWGSDRNTQGPWKSSPGGGDGVWSSEAVTAAEWHPNYPSPVVQAGPVPSSLASFGCCHLLSLVSHWCWVIQYPSFKFNFYPACQDYFLLFLSQNTNW